MARGLKFQIKEVEGLYYLCSENKGADQLCGYRTAGLRLCFRIHAKSRFFHDAAHLDPPRTGYDSSLTEYPNYTVPLLSYGITKIPPNV